MCFRYPTAYPASAPNQPAYFLDRRWPDLPGLCAAPTPARARGDKCGRALGHPTTLRFRLPEDYAETWLPQVLRAFEASHPAVRPHIHCRMSTELVEQLEAGALDLVLTVRHSTASVARHVGTEALVWAAHRDFKIAADESLPLALFPEQCIYRRRALEALTRIGRAWQIDYTSQSPTGLRVAVDQGRAVTITGRRTLPTGWRILGEEDGLPQLPDAMLEIHRSPSVQHPAFDAFTGLAEQTLNTASSAPGRDPRVSRRPRQTSHRSRFFEGTASWPDHKRVASGRGKNIGDRACNAAAVRPRRAPLQRLAPCANAAAGGPAGDIGQHGQPGQPGSLHQERPEQYARPPPGALLAEMVLLDPVCGHGFRIVVFHAHALVHALQILGRQLRGDGIVAPCGSSASTRPCARPAGCSARARGSCCP